MRFLSFCMIAIVAMMMTSAAMARKPEGRVFMSSACGAPVSCASVTGGADNPNMRKVISDATTCATSRLGIAAPKDGMFDTYGLDSDRCLSTKTFPKKGNSVAATMVPYCCMKDIGGGQCQLTCQSVATH